MHLARRRKPPEDRNRPPLRLQLCSHPLLSAKGHSRLARQAEKAEKAYPQWDEPFLTSSALTALLALVSVLNHAAAESRAKVPACFTGSDPRGLLRLTKSVKGLWFRARSLGQHLPLRGSLPQHPAGSETSRVYLLPGHFSREAVAANHSQFRLNSLAHKLF